MQREHAPNAANVARALSLYEEAADYTKRSGHEWYLREHEYATRLAERSGYQLRLVCACLAILSPRCRWPHAKWGCEKLLAGKTPTGIFSGNRGKAAEILATGNTDQIDPRRSPKTWAFWRNLWRPFDPEPVTLDAWMFRAHGKQPNASLQTYKQLAETYRSLAAELGLIPNQLQATIWLHARRTLKIGGQNGAPANI